MKKYLLSTFFLFCLLSVFGQAENRSPKSDRVFYSLAYYDLFESNISGSVLEKLTKANYGFGDKALAREVILRQMIFSKQESGLLDSLFQYKDLPSLKKLPAISQNVLERPNRLINFYLINEMLQFKTDNFYENIFQVIPKLKKKLNPDDSITFEDDQMETDEIAISIKEYTDAIEWLQGYPQGVNFFLDYFGREWEKFHRQHPGYTMADLYTFKVDTANKMYPIMDYYLPVPLSVCISEYGRHKSIIPKAESISNDPESFIENTFVKLLRRKPTSSELNELLPLFKSKMMDPELLYYVIMSSEEYSYY